jgi:CDP-diacylglycerol--glycerol-3-phosphate 3-phosphatidyltransferase
VVLSAPEVLIAFRAACAPAIFVLACFGFPGPLLAGVLLAAFVSDILDGVVARRLGCITPGLRHADTLVDTLFYVAAAIALWVAVPGAFAAASLPLALLIAIHVSRTTFELTKYGRVASYHMWSSKALGIVLVITMTTVFLTGRPSVLIPLTLWFGIANELEGFAASAILPAWIPDVPSLLHAQQIHRGQPRPRPDDVVRRDDDEQGGRQRRAGHHHRLHRRDAVEDRRRERHQRES